MYREQVHKIESSPMIYGSTGSRSSLELSLRSNFLSCQTFFNLLLDEFHCYIRPYSILSLSPHSSPLALALRSPMAFPTSFTVAATIFMFIVI